MRNRQIILLFAFIFFCACQDKKLTIYQFKNDVLELEAYFFSSDYSERNDLVLVYCKSDPTYRINIFKIEDGLQLVKVQDSTISISFNSSKGHKPIIQRFDNVCGYQIEYHEAVFCR